MAKACAQSEGVPKPRRLCNSCFIETGEESRDAIDSFDNICESCEEEIADDDA
jgi:hypothetical protein